MSAFGPKADIRREPRIGSFASTTAVKLFGDRAGGPLLIAAPRSSPQHLKYDGGRPTKHQDTVHRRYWPKQSPALHRNYVAVAERRVVHESEIHWVGTGGCSTDDRVGQ